MSMSVAVVGASRGLGLSLARLLLASPQINHAVLTCRDPSHMPKDILSHPKTHAFPVSANDEESVASVAKYVKTHLNGKLNAVVHVAGVLHDEQVYPETSITKVKRDAMMHSFEVNSVFPAMTAKHFLPLLKAAAASPDGSGEPVYAALSARIGSIGDNRLGGWVSYRASKAALNQLIKTLAVEGSRVKPRPVVAVGIHPGTCVTDLTAPFRKNVDPATVRSAERGAEDIWKIVATASAQGVSGKCVAYDGTIVPP
ncbi:short chain dehydrogenase [Pycnococcus provasolii]